MGALAENRKRLPDLCPLTAPSKKMRTSSPPTNLHRMAMAPQFPPLNPLRRPVHGPQRILRSFRLGSARSRPKSPPEMADSVSRILDRRRSAIGMESCRNLEDYRRMVIEAQEVVRSPAVELSPPSWEPLDLRHVDLELELEPLEENLIELDRDDNEADKEEEDRVPFYKKLYEESGRKRDSRIKDLEFEVKLAERKLLGFRLVDEVLKKKKPDKGQLVPFTPLTDEDEQDVDFAIRGSKRREVLVTHAASGIEITREVLRCLRNSAWLNDEVINLYLELLKERERREPKRFLKCHFFNTFFYKRLFNGENYDFKAVKRWTTQKKLGYSLIDCDKIFVPIHKQVHWCLAIINVKDRKFQYLDSLGGMDRNVLSILARYFMDEVSDKSNRKIDTLSWLQEPVDNLPLQQNGFDCGMFMLKYIDFYCRGLNLSFGQEHMQYFRKRTAKEILRLIAE